MGQEAIVFKRNGIGPIEEWEPLEAPARRRRWFHDGEGTLAVLLASASDLDDLIPTLVAYQIEWNKLRVKLRAAERARRRPLAGRSWPPRSAARRRTGRACARPGARASASGLRDVRDRRLNLRVRMLGGSAVGYARMTRRWWRPVRRRSRSRRSRTARSTSSPPTRTRSSTSLTGTAREREKDIVDWVERSNDPDLEPELDRFRSGEAEGSWENLLYFARARLLQRAP